MKLSIIIPMYNVELYIERCLLSCLSQDVSSDEYEIIVVNDGSPDGSLQIAERIASQANNVQIISQANGGLSAARNTGLKYAKGEYVWFVDSDDWIEENCLKQLIDSLYNEDLDALCINGIRFKDGIYQKLPPLAVTGRIVTGIDLLDTTLVNCASVKTIYRKDVLLKNNVNFLHGIFHEDAEFTPRAYYYVKRITAKNFYFYYNFLNTSSITQTVNPKKGFDLIKVACSLDCFRKTLPICHQNKFDKYIVSALNQSFNNAVLMEKGILDLYLNEIINKKYLFKSYIKSQRIVYIIEGLLFTLFPKRCVSIFRGLQKLKKSMANN